MKCAALLLVASLLAACRASAAFEVLDQGDHSGVHEAGVQLINDPDAWKTFWERHASWRLPAPPMPEVDFARHSVVVVRAGDQPSAGCVLNTLSVSGAPDALQVEAVLDLPPRGASAALVVTQPYQILLVPRASRLLLVKVDQRQSNG